MNSSRYKGSMVSWTTFIWRAHQYMSTIHCCSVKWEFAKKGPSLSAADFLQGVSLIPICYKFIQRPRNLWSTELLHTYLLLSVTSFALKSQPRSMSDWKLLPYIKYIYSYLQLLLLVWECSLRNYFLNGATGKCTKPAIFFLLCQAFSLSGSPDTYSVSASN